MQDDLPVQAQRVRILVVDDYEPWHHFYSTWLQKLPNLQIVAHVSDGLEAFQQAQELRPDLILLDIGLPTLNGIEAARRIERVPHVQDSIRGRKPLR